MTRRPFTALDRAGLAGNIPWVDLIPLAGATLPIRSMLQPDRLALVLKFKALNRARRGEFCFIQHRPTPDQQPIPAYRAGRFDCDYPVVSVERIDFGAYFCKQLEEA